MNWRRCIILAGALALGVGLAAPAGAAEPVRIHYFGNSLTDQLRYDYFKKLAGEAGHPLDWKREMAPGVSVSFWWSQKAKWEKKLTEEKWDVVTLQPFQNFEVEYQACEEFARFLNEKQPDVQLYIYAQWQGRRTGDWLSDFSQTNAVVSTTDWNAHCRKQAGESSWLENVAADARKAGLTGKLERGLKNQYELTVEGLRARVPMKKPAKLIPVGHVLELLDSKMRAGLVPGFASPYDLYIDGVHINNVGDYIVACTFYATLFAASPVGLPVGEYQAGPHQMGFPRRISDELARVIQETVWEVVATHPLTGVTSSEPPRVATAALPIGIQGEPYRVQLAPAFGKAPYTWRVASGKLSAGLNLGADGLISGTVAEAPGECRPTLAVRDASGAVGTRELALAIEADTAPAITTSPELPARRLGEFFALKLAAKGGNGAMQWAPAMREGKLPPGLMLHPDGTLSGAPGQEGPHTFELKVSDADGGKPESATCKFSIAVTAPGPGVFRVRPVTQEVKADGVLDEPFWNLQEPIAKRVAGDATNVKATFDIVRRGGDMYVAVKVVDPDRKVDLKDLPNGDSVELFVDVLNNREEVYNYDDRRIVVAPFKGWYQGLLVAPTTFGHRGQCVETADGYTAEFWLSFWALSFQNRNFPAVMGLDIAVNDDDDGNGRDSQVVWQGTARNDKVPKFGTIVIEGDGPRADDPQHKE